MVTIFMAADSLWSIWATLKTTTLHEQWVSLFFDDDLHTMCFGAYEMFCFLVTEDYVVQCTHLAVFFFE